MSFSRDGASMHLAVLLGQFVDDFASSFAAFKIRFRR